MWDELVNSFDLTVTKEDIKRYNEMKKKGYYDMELNLEQAKSILKDKVFEIRKGEVLAEKAIDIVLTELERLQKENEELNVKILSNAGIYQLGFRDGEKTYIQKVKYKIEELEQEIKEYIETDNTGRFTRENCILTSEVNVLRELLERE